MLFWSFILAFVLGILYYMSPVYNVVDVEQKPQADTMVSAFVNTHQAAKRMMYTDKGSVTNQCDSTDDSGNPIKIDCLDDEGNPIEVEDTSQRVITFTYKTAMADLKDGLSADCSVSPECIFSQISKGEYPTSPVPSYSQGALATINADDMRKMLAVVPKNDDGTDKFSDITSMVACISNESNEKDETGMIKTTDPYLTFDCQGGKTGGIGDYVITYMRAPGSSRASSSSDEAARRELWRSALLRRTKGSHECGVLWKTNAGKITLAVEEFQRTIDIGSRKKYDENSPYIMDNSRRFTLSVPTLIGKAIEESSDNVDADGNGKKDITEDMELGYLLFCITPIDDIRASFEWKNKHGYGVYQITDE